MVAIVLNRSSIAPLADHVIVAIALPRSLERNRPRLDLGFFARAFAPRDRTKRFLRLAPRLARGDIAAFAVETENGEEVPAVLVHCRVSDPEERRKLHDEIRDKVRSITGMNCVVELVPPRTLPRTSSGKLSRAKAKKQYLSGEIEPFKLLEAA